MMAISGTEHPYNKRYPTPSDTKMLIVGTAPPPRFCKVPWSCEDDLDFDFFYGSGSNWMWGILPAALNEPGALPETLPAEECKNEAASLLTRHKLWMQDVLACVRRKRGKENSAKDCDIEPPSEADFADFEKIFESAPNLGAIATTSEDAFAWLMQALKFQGLTSVDGRSELKVWQTFCASDHEPDVSGFWIDKHSRKVTTLKLREKDSKVDIYILPSPSSRRAGLTIECKTQVYRHILELVGILP